MKRVLFDFLLFLSVFLFPWWVTLILVCIGLFLFPTFYEFLIASVVMYALFVSPLESVRWFAHPLWFSILVIGFYLGVQSAQRLIIFYKSS
ncbi:MAG: hypothetical protein WC059_00990 [Candidatus Paceibacterota bacterium]